MEVKTKYRQFIHYSLILCILLIQIVILIFFYNEYYNGKKLDEIGARLEETRVLKNIAEDSKDELGLAKDYLRKYLNEADRESLEMYFESLQKLTSNIEVIKTNKDKDSLDNKVLVFDDEDVLKYDKLEILIDSIYKESQKPGPEEIPYEFREVEFKDNRKHIEFEVIYIEDSTEKKKFFPRVFDAISGKETIKSDTVFISSKYAETVDTLQIKQEFESTVSSIDEHYKGEIEKYKDYVSNLDSRNNRFYRIYENLIVLSGELLGIYDYTVDDLSFELQKEYNKQNSINNKIRRFTVLTLMILTFIVLIMLMYYTKQSFVYQKELNRANLRISEHLNFKNRILGMLSHEIRSPLKIINIFIDRISRRTDDPTILDNLKSIKFTNDSLLIQANQILEYTKNQDNNLELNSVEFDIKEEIDSILNIFRPFIESGENVFVTQNNIDPNVIVSADNAKIHQIFTNILGNASKFTRGGEIKVTVNTGAVEKNKLKLEVTVSDTGAGISESDLKKIFEPYYKGVISDKVENIGAGLGLNLCREIIQLLDGEIKVKSTLGEGTEVYFEIELDIKND